MVKIKVQILLKMDMENYATVIFNVLGVNKMLKTVQNVNSKSVLFVASVGDGFTADFLSNVVTS